MSKSKESKAKESPHIRIIIQRCENATLENNDENSEIMKVYYVGLISCIKF